MRAPLVMVFAARSRVAVSALGLGLCMALSSHALAQAPAATEGLSIRDLQMDVEVFKALYGMGLTAQQAADVLGACKAPAEFAEKLKQVNAAPAARAAMLAIRTAAGSGREVTDAMWAELTSAREAALGAPGPGQEAEDPDIHMWTLGRNAGGDILKLLTPDQVAYLLAPELAESTQSTVAQLGEARGASPEEWQQWRDGVVSDITADRKDMPDLPATLTKILDGARGLTPDEFSQQQGGLATKLRKALTPQVGEEERTDRVTEWFAYHLAEVPRFLVCLREYVEAKQAAEAEKAGQK